MPTEKPNFSLVKNLTLILLVSITWLLFLRWPRPVSIKIDESWAQVLGWAMQTQQQVGVDYVWTYGPLGYFANAYSTFRPELFYPFVIWSITAATIVCLLLLLYSWQKPFIIKLSLWFVSALFVAPSLDIQYFVIIVLSCFLLIDPPAFLKNPKYYNVLYLFVSTILSCIALTKFTFFVLIVSGLILVWIKLYSQYFLKGLVSAVTVNLVLFLIIWILTGQSIANIPSFIYYGFQISSGFSWAMSGGDNITDNIFASINIALILLLLVIVIWQRRQQLTIWLKAAIVMLMLFLAWKVGFVRHNVHVFNFFSIALILPFIFETGFVNRYQRTFVYGILLLNSTVYNTFC